MQSIFLIAAIVFSTAFNAIARESQKVESEMGPRTSTQKIKSIVTDFYAQKSLQKYLTRNNRDHKNPECEEPVPDKKDCMDVVCKHVASYECNDADDLAKISNMCAKVYDSGCIENVCSKVASYECNDLDDMKKITNMCKNNFDGRCVDIICSKVASYECNDLDDMNKIGGICQQVYDADCINHVCNKLASYECNDLDDMKKIANYCKNAD